MYKLTCTEHFQICLFYGHIFFSAAFKKWWGHIPPIPSANLFLCTKYNSNPMQRPFTQHCFQQQQQKNIFCCLWNQAWECLFNTGVFAVYDEKAKSSEFIDYKDNTDPSSNIFVICICMMYLSQLCSYANGIQGRAFIWRLYALFLPTCLSDFIQWWDHKIIVLYWSK